MEVQNQKRLITIKNNSIKCYYYNYFKAPGLSKYPNKTWVNADYDLIKQTTISTEDTIRIANNLYNVGQKYNLFSDLHYVIMMPKKSNSVSSFESIINELVNIIKNKLNYEIQFINDIFQVDNYRKFWEYRLKVNERKTEITNKIHLLDKYINFFDNKNIMIVDDIVSTGTSIAQIASIILNNNNDVNINALCYGTVYKWEEIYS